MRWRTKRKGEVRMKNVFAISAIAALVITLAGCSVNTKLVERERVDQQIKGNQGYLTGTAPATGERKATRKYFEVQVEVPPAEESRVPKKALEIPAPARVPVTNFSAVPAVQQPVKVAIEPAAQEEFTNYTVQKGDTLQKISMKLFGTTKKWKKIFNANRDVLKSPDKVKPGMVLKIPKSENVPIKEKGSEFIK